MSNIKYVKDHSTQEIIYPVVKAGGIIDAWDIMDEDIYNLFYPRVEGIEIKSKDLTLDTYGTKTLKYSLTPEDAHNQKVDWTISNKDTITFDSKNMVVTGLLPGVSDLTVTSKDGGFSDSIAVTVKDVPTNTILYRGPNVNSQLEFQTYNKSEYNNKIGRVTYSSPVEYLPAQTFQASNTDVLYLPDTIIEIGDDCITNLPKLTQLVLPSNLQTVAGASVWGLGVTELNLPDSLVSVDKYAFTDNKCTELLISEHLQSIGIGAFTGNPYQSIVVDPANPIYDSRDNCNALIETATNTLQVGCVNSVIPEGIISIAEQAFYNSAIETVSIPASVSDINQLAFYLCNNLASYNVHPDNLVYSSIDGSLYDKEQTNILAFPPCVEVINIPDTVTEIPFDSSLNNANLKVFNSGNSVTTIPSGLLEGCSNVEELTIGESVTSFDSHDLAATSPNTVNWNAAELAFNSGYVTSVDTLNIGPRVTSFPGLIYPINHITVHPDNPQFDSREDCNAIIETSTNVLLQGSNSAHIPDGITEINARAFNECTALTSITIPNSVTYIGSYAFYNCKSLTSITIPDNVTYIGYDTFCKCSGLTSVTIGNSVTSINDNVFARCSSLTSITIPNSVTQISYGAFTYCTNLTSITVGEGVSQIVSGVFDNCKAITSVTWNAVNCTSDLGGLFDDSCDSISEFIIGDKVEVIPSGLIPYSETKILSIELPASVMEIKDYALSASVLLLTLNSVTPPILGTQDLNSSIQIIVPEEAVDVYKTSDGWSMYADMIVSATNNNTES